MRMNHDCKKGKKIFFFFSLLGQDSNKKWWEVFIFYFPKHIYNSLGRRMEKRYKVKNEKKKQKDLMR